MTALATAPTLFDDLGGEPTLDDMLGGVWEGLTAHRSVECVICGGEMEPVVLPGETAVAGGRCTSCGTKLA